MSTQAWAIEMALYNKWQNDKLFGLCDALSDQDRMQDRGLYFGSIHRTLDHILMVDRVLWHFTVHGEPPKDWDANKKLYDDYPTLRQERIAFDAALLDALRARSDAWLDETVAYHHPRLGRKRSHPRQFTLMQLFNHATHHRSQVTSTLHQMGIDYGSTDLPYNPLSQY
jgi:uncharacterized damage-inducible protein DinB